MQSKILNKEGLQENKWRTIQNT